jgi:C-terminal processing protease CtpA/Prc
MLCVNLTFAQIPNELSKADKIFILSKFWQEVNYNFVYMDKVDKTEWDEMYKDLISDVQSTKNDYEYYKVLKKFCAYLKDGHTNVYFPKTIRDSILSNNFGEYRMFFSNIEGKAILTRTNDSKKSEIPIGTEVLKVNGLTTREHLEKNVFPYISTSTDYILEDLGIEDMFEGYVGTSYDVEMRTPNGKIKTLNLTLSKTKERDLYPPIEERNFVDFKWIDNNIAYVALNSFDDWKASSEFGEKIPELKKAKALIIDLRNNTGGNSRIGKVILHHLTNDTIFYGSKSQSRLHIPTLKAWGQEKYYHDFEYSPDTLGIGDRNLLKTSRVVVPTAILIGHRTASAAEDFLIYADNQKHMTRIGENTYGSTGQPLFFELPNGAGFRICTKKDTYPDGREFVGYGIKPDIEVKKTLTDYIENKDPALVKAIELLTVRK